MRSIAKMFRVVFWAALCAALCAMVFLAPGSAVAAVARQGSIEVHGQTRTYTVYLPERIDPARRYPIVMILHGGAGNGERIAQKTGFGAYVDQGGFIAVFPNSNGAQWNDGREAAQSSRDDVDFLVAVVQDLVARSAGDPARVFVGGESNGGMMVQRLACEATNVFAAYAVVVANMPYGLAGTCRPARRAPFIFFESTADPIMPFAGGEIRIPWGRQVGRVLSVPQTIDLWSRFNGCGRPQIYDVPNRVNDNTSVRQHNFGACGLVLYEIQGGGHAWPGSELGGFFGQRRVGNTTHQIEATSLIIDFFRRYGL